MSIKVKDYEVRKGLFYTKTHEWAKVDEDQVTVGVTDYAQKAMHEVVFVEVPQVNRQVKKGEVISAIESTKAVSEVYSPVDGVIIRVNDALQNSPELVNKDPYGDGWIAIIKATRIPREDLLTDEEYARYLEAEVLKE
ncbi:MAG: glycine cleavage system protein GcvH [Candidatus Methanomethylicota archaeon]|uniref:Probable glycine cleavage system H protein n=1 Tax=Thermoproteota archaeon TaxID=2056631 RepID=A0A497ETC0_9CREN|nr:MAG: glycine cleavage system protein GcvH [Candidatus Verstraetearchaeota archaeon]